MEQNERKKNRRRTAVSYDIREFIYGHTEYVTDCPFGEYGRYTHAINKVGALECNRCPYQIKNNTEAQIVRCSHDTDRKEVIHDYHLS
jgi:hypothetical protein